ncbi:transferase mitochondrial [Chlorella sorokiniana]|uniref:Transferase mitochondrial n=1 Tax=Chlorella sorokiniana TaxID=3076 RepID=A0A2P6TVT5_CHLSO|nr:transferase mitochondrial [Chlorella sorokiniana]|eukprot:PRW58166.1 transferase mitochondrial [Chlorella sorokiniana]
MLNAQGRHLHDLLLYRTSDVEPTVLADVDAAGMEDLLRLLKRYRLRQKLDIQDVSQQYRVWARWGGAAGDSSAAPSPGWLPDPRLPQLGLRAVLPRGEEGEATGGSADWEAHRRWRMLHGVAEGDSEIPSGEVIPLEFNLDGLNGISFTKGCYVGQELMARTHFKGVVRKRLMPFLAAPAGWPPVSEPQVAAAAAVAAAGSGSSSGGSSSSALQPGAAVYVEHEGGKRKSVGVVRVADGPLGMAVLRMAAAQAAQAAGQPLLVGEGDAVQQLFPWRPEWWPRSWGHEEEDGAAGADS